MRQEREHICTPDQRIREDILGARYKCSCGKILAVLKTGKGLGGYKK